MHQKVILTNIILEIRKTWVNKEENPGEWRLRNSYPKNCTYLRRTMKQFYPKKKKLKVKKSSPPYT